MFPGRFTPKRFLFFSILGVLLPTAFLAYLSLFLHRQVFQFENRILSEYALFSVDYAVSEVQNLIRARERDVHTHFRMSAILQNFDPGTQLGRIEGTYPLIAHAFLMRENGDLAFADDDPEASGRGVIAQAATEGHDPLWIDSLLQLGRDTAEGILQRVVDAETRDRLLHSDETRFFRGQESGEPFHLTAFGLFDANDRPYGVAGFFLNLPYVREKYLASLLEEAIETAEGRFSPDFGRYLTFLVSDHNGELVYVHKRPGATESPSEWEYISEAELWDVLPGWHVKLVYSDPKGASHRRDIWLANTLLLVVMAMLALVGVLLSMRFGLRQMELSNMKSHFVSNITHELKTPLSAIRLYVETLQEGRVRDQEQGQKFLGIINKESVRLTHLINNILDFSRIEMGRKRYKRESTSLGAVVHDVVDSYAYQLQDKGCKVNVDIEDGLPQVYVDRDALSQAVLNLLDNAVKYGGSRKEIEVTVARDADSRGQDGIRIAVRDHGVGIPASERKRIFDAFYRVEKGLEHDVKGSGLGLAVVKHVAEAHGGSVSVDSQPGAGSTFTIRLPVEAGR